jgi:drug/metabolite transporter (DMT)-like permease
LIKNATHSDWLLLGLSVFAISWSAPLIRLAFPIPVLVIVFARLGFAFLIMFFFSWYRKEKTNYSFTRNSNSLLILAGLSLGAHFWFWTESLKHTSIIISVVLVTLHPIFVGFGAYFFLKEPFSRSLVFGAAIALLGTLIMTGMDISLQNSLWGNFLALIGGIFFSIFLVVSRAMRKEISTFTYSAIVYGLATLFVGFGFVFSDVQFVTASPSAYWALIGIVVLPQLIGHTTINWTLGIFPAAIVGIAIVCEPIGASLLAVILLDEIPTLFEMVGALIIVSGVYIAIRNRAVVSNDKKMCI